MPFDTPPGQVLSSVPSSADKRKSSKLGGCAGVLFQIFHGKRLFPRKSLPAERPKQTVSNHTDDKLPIAKLLLIADENGSGPLKDADDVLLEVEDVAKVESYEEKVPRRTPGVIARLMGLETMPFPESMCGESKQSDLLRNMDYPSSTDGPQPDRQTSFAAMAQQYSLLQRAKSEEYKTDLHARFAAHQSKKVKDGSAKAKVPAKVPSLPPHHLDSSFPSLAKGDSLNKNFIRTQKTAHFFEVSPKMIKANLQPNRQARSQRLQSSFSGTKAGSLNPKSTNVAAQVPCSRRDDGKVVQAAPCYTSNGMTSRRQIIDSQKSQPAQQHILNSSKCSSHEVPPVKRKQGYHGALEQPKAALIEKSRSDWRRQDEISRRLSQPTVCSSQRARPSRHRSPPKSFQDSSGGACSSQGSNCIPSSSERALSSQLIKSRVGSNNVSAAKHSRSSVGGSLAKLENADEFMDTMQSLESIYKEVTDLPHGNTNTLKNSDVSLPAEPENSLYSQFSQDGSTSSAIYTESLQRSSLESSVSSDPSLSEFTTSSEENVAGHKRGEETWKDDHRKLHGIKRNDFFLTELSSESLSESLTVSLAGDLSSSRTLSDGNAKSADSAHTYSGRNTAAILQELLTALSSSSTHRKSSIAKNAEGTTSCSLDSEVEKAQFLSVGNAHCTEELYMESSFQDSASSTSCDSFQIARGNEDCEVGNSMISKDCASIAEMQAEDGYPPGKSRTGRSQLQLGLSRDCEALMSTISKLHHIDPEVIGLKVRTEDGLSLCLHDSVYPDKPEEQTQQLDVSLSSSTAFLCDNDAESIYRSDIESSFLSGYDEVTIRNKKLLTDCINEAFKSLSKQIYKFSSTFSEPPSATHVLSRVYKQLDEWRAMATSMNLDNMIEKEMNLTTRSWRNIGAETEEVAEVVESTIFSGLLEEVLLELI